MLFAEEKIDGPLKSGTNLIIMLKRRDLKDIIAINFFKLLNFFILLSNSSLKAKEICNSYDVDFLFLRYIILNVWFNRVFADGYTSFKLTFDYLKRNEKQILNIFNIGSLFHHFYRLSLVLIFYNKCIYRLAKITVALWIWFQ